MPKVQFSDVTRVLIEPRPVPSPHEKPQLLPGIWLDNVATTEFSDALKQYPADPNLADMRFVLVVDTQAYVRGLLNRLESVKSVQERLANLTENANSDFEHPLEAYVEIEDLIRLVMTAFILAGANAIMVDRPISVETTTSGDTKATVARGRSNLRYVWQCPHETRVQRVREVGNFIGRLDLGAVQKYCAALDPYFRPIQWHSGRLAVALSAFLSYVMAANDVQGYLSLMTVLEALLSASDTEVTHQISERVACLLETEVDMRITLYQRMKKLYAVRSKLVHGSVRNRGNAVTHDRLRVDAKFRIVPDHDYGDLFSICIRCISTVLKTSSLKQRWRLTGNLPTGISALSLARQRMMPQMPPKFAKANSRALTIRILLDT